MKLRIRGNSIRLRLQMSEIERLSETGNVSETTHFSSDQRLKYSVRSSESAIAIEASFGNDEVSIVVPLKIAEEWCSTEKVSLKAVQTIDEGSVLKILLEKDFKCLARSEGEDDMFPNPKESH